MKRDPTVPLLCYLIVWYLVIERACCILFFSSYNLLSNLLSPQERRYSTLLGPHLTAAL